MKQKKLSLVFLGAVLCCALVLIPVICSILYFNTAVSRRLEDHARETVSFYLDQLTDNISVTLDTLRNSIYYLMSDDGTQRLMRHPNMATPGERLTVEEGLSRTFFIRNGLDAVTGIYLVKNETQYLSVLRSGIYSGTSNRILGVFRDCGDANSARELYTNPNYPGYCYFIVDYLDLDSMQPLGKIIMELDAEALVNASPIDNLYQQAEVMLVSTGGYDLNQSSDAFTQAAAGKEPGYLEVNGQKYYHASRNLSPFRAHIGVFVPSSEIFEAAHTTTKIYIIFAIIILFITLAIGFGAVYLVFKPLRQMLHRLDRLGAGELSVRMDATPYRETQHLAYAFNHMADRLNALFDENYQKGLLLRDAEFNLLESQIRPHFIFNVLELINMRCLEAGENDICHLVTNLAQLIRVNITQRLKQTISFQDELRYVRYYLELQKERFGTALQYFIDLEDPIILQYYLPKLTIQPLVENGIVHGLENKRGGGTIRVGIWEEEDAVCIRVSDDGIGFDPSLVKLENTDETTHHNHIAIANINRRIQLLYGRMYGLHISSSPGHGTDITVTLPIDTGSSEQRSEQEC